MHCLLTLLSQVPLECCQSYLPFHSLISARRNKKRSLSNQEIYFLIHSYGNGKVCIQAKHFNI